MLRRRLIPILFGLGIVAILVWIRIADPYVLQATRDVAFDGFQRAAPREPADFPVRIVDVDEASLSEIGQWPWPRDVMATLAERLTALGAAAVVFDIVFPEPDRTSPNRVAETIAEQYQVQLVPADIVLPDHDQQFAAALAAAPAVLGFGASATPTDFMAPAKAGFAIVGPNHDLAVPHMGGAIMSLPELVSAARGLGSFSLDPGGSVAAVRRLPLLWSDGTNLYPSLSIEALRVALGIGAVVVFSDQNGYGVVDSIRLGNFEIPTTPQGSLWLYYQPTQPDLYVSARDVLGPNWTDTAPLIAGNIVFIGTSATGLLDVRGTPLGYNMPGVEIHAQAVQQILSGSYLQRADWIDGAEILALILIGVAIVFAIIFSGPLICLLIGAVLVAALAGASWFAYTEYGWLIDPSYPLIGSFIVYTAMIFFQYTISNAARRKITGAFSNYVSPALLAQIEKNSDSLKLGGETRELSIMFSDVRDFTTLSEGLAPPDLVHLLNTLFGALGTRITDQFGTIDKFIGDAIMAFWNAPVDVERHSYRACISALGMRRTLRELNARDAFGLRARGAATGEINIGIGISTGEALVGNLGLESRFDYSCVGDVVNVASRVEGACKSVGYDILVVDRTRAEAPELAFLEAGAIPLKGKSRPETIHLLVGDEALAASPEFVALRDAHGEVMKRMTSQEPAAAAIDRCLALITFPDDRLHRFYDKLRHAAAAALRPAGELVGSAS